MSISNYSGQQYKETKIISLISEFVAGIFYYYSSYEQNKQSGNIQ